MQASPKAECASDEVILALENEHLRVKEGYRMVARKDGITYILASWSRTPPPRLMCRFRVIIGGGREALIEWIGFPRATPEEAGIALAPQS